MFEILSAPFLHRSKDSSPRVELLPSSSLQDDGAAAVCLAIVPRASFRDPFLFAVGQLAVAEVEPLQPAVGGDAPCQRLDARQVGDCGEGATTRDLPAGENGQGGARPRRPMALVGDDHEAPLL